jgi:hypothetical protein
VLGLPAVHGGTVSAILYIPAPATPTPTEAQIAEAWRALNVYGDEHLCTALLALRARDAEIARLRERVAEVEGERDGVEDVLAFRTKERDAALTRAERAERIAADQERSCTRMEALLLAAGERATEAERGLAAIVEDLGKRAAKARERIYQSVLPTGEWVARELTEAADAYAASPAGTALSVLLADAEARGRREEREAIAADLTKMADGARPLDAVFAMTLSGLAGRYRSGAHLPPKRPTTTDTSEKQS